MNLIQYMLPSLDVVFQIGGIGLLSYGITKLIIGKKPEPVEKTDDFFINSKLYIEEEERTIRPELIEYKKHEHGYTIIYSIPSGLCLDDFKKKKEGLEHQLDADIDMWSEGYKLYIKAAVADLPKVLDYKDMQLDKEVEVPVGQSREGFKTNRLKDGYNMMICGPIGSGKSVFLRQALMAMIDNYGSSQIEIYLSDLKRTELHHFLKAEQVRGIAECEEEIEIMLDQLIEVIDNRAEELREKKIDKIKGNKSRIVLIIDEFPELSSNKAIMSKIESILRLGRASGVHTVLTAHRPEVKIITGQMKNNIDCRLAFKTPTKTDSRTVLENGDAALLPPIKGRAIYQEGWRNIEVQVPFISLDKVKKELEDYEGGEAELIC